MSTILKRETKTGVKYQVRIKQGDRILKTKSFAKLKLAREWKQRMEADKDLMAATGCPGSVMRFESFCAEYLSQWKGKSIESQTSRLAWWQKFIGNKRLTDITSHEVRTGLKIVEEIWAPGTVNRYRTVLSGAFTYAKKQEYVLRNPVESTSCLTTDDKRVRYLSDDERERLLKACKGSRYHRLYLIVMLAISTGARKSELINLRWSDIDLKVGKAIVKETKNGDPRILTIPAHICALLQDIQEIGNGLVFPSAKNPQRPAYFRKAWESALKVAGVEDFRFHDLRHTTASYLVMSGATLYETGEILGHRSQQTTARYAHFSIKHKKELTDRILGGILANDYSTTELSGLEQRLIAVCQEIGAIATTKGLHTKHLSRQIAELEKPVEDLTLEELLTISRMEKVHTI